MDLVEIVPKRIFIAPVELFIRFEISGGET